MVYRLSKNGLIIGFLETLSVQDIVEPGGDIHLVTVAWPFLVGGVICLLNCVNERDLDLLNSPFDFGWTLAS